MFLIFTTPSNICLAAVFRVSKDFGSFGPQLILLAQDWLRIGSALVRAGLCFSIC